ncbi:MAG: hypothetical protein U9Q68_08710 [Euryarchaeota archaeon]|nr:hypothetical protein [Euryarchaeota archaeon]
MPVTLPNEKFLRTEVVLSKVFEIMEPYLAFHDILPKVRAPERVVRYKQETVSASTDTKKKTPRTRTPGSKWAQLGVTPMKIKAGVLNQEGFEIRIDEDAVQYSSGIDQIKRAYNRAAYWLAEHVNTSIATALTAGATTPTWTPTAVWSDATASPVVDLLDFRHQMKREGYPYKLSDVFIHNDNLNELRTYLTTIDVNDLKQKAIFGMPDIADDYIDIPVVHARMHGLMSGITEGYILGIDRRNPAGTFFYNNNPKYGSETIKYRNSEGKLVTVPNFGINVHRYHDDESHDEVFQLWVDSTTEIMEPYAALYDSGI